MSELLPGFDAPGPEKPKGESARLTYRRERLLEQGRNPGTGQPVIEGTTKTCGDCFHAINASHGRRKYWKCEMGILSWSATSDIRLKWPACTSFSAEDDGKSEAPAWVARASRR